MDHLQRQEALPTNTLLLYYGIFAGPLAWAGDEGLSYMLEQHSCSTGHFYLLHIITAAAFAIALSGALVAWRQATLTGPASEDGGSVRDRAYFMARLGIAMGLGFALIIIAMGVPRWVLSPCD